MAKGKELSRGEVMIRDICLRSGCIFAKTNTRSLESDKKHPHEEYYCFKELNPEELFKKDACESAAKSDGDSDRTYGILTSSGTFTPRPLQEPALDFDPSHNYIPLYDWPVARK